MSESASSLVDTPPPADAQGAAAAAGEGASETAGDGVGAAEVRTLDFSEPTRFTPELRRRVAHALESFCKAAPSRLSAELGAPLELHARTPRQLSFASSRAALPEQALAITLRSRASDGRMLLALERPFLISALSCLLGGGPDDATEERALSDLDRALMRRVLDGLVLALSDALSELGELDLLVESDDPEDDVAAIAPGAEPTLLVTLECALAEQRSELSLLIPWHAIEPLAGGVSDVGSAPSAAEPHEELALRQGLAGAKMLVRAEIGSTRLPVERVLAITPGPVLRLDARAEQGVRVLADRVELARGVPGRNGSRRAVKLTCAVAPRRDPDAPSLPAPSTHADGAARGQAQTLRERLSHLRGVDLRVWAELGRASLMLGHLLRLREGALVELDESAEEPVGVFVGGVRLASGALLVTAEGEWAVRVDAIG